MIWSLHRLALLAQVIALPLVAKPLWVYFGDAGMQPDSVIYSASFDPDTGALSEPVAAAPAWNPVFMDTDPKHRYLYAITGKPGGPKQLPLDRLLAFKIDPQTGSLSLISDVMPGDKEACHVAVTPDGRSLLLANYLNGTTDVFALNSDGTLGAHTATQQHTGSGPMTSRQEGPHAHCVNLDPSGRYLISNDLGADKIYIYHFDAKHQTLTPAEPAFVAISPGAGPRHFAFAPSGKFAYAVTELTSTVITFRWDGQHGTLQPLQTQSLLAADFKGTNLTSEVALDQAGKYLYAGNRGENSVVVFSIDQHTGALTFVQRLYDGINLPRSFAIDPSGHWLIAANTGTDNVVVYRVDPASGRLSATDQVRKLPKPLCVLFVPHA